MQILATIATGGATVRFVEASAKTERAEEMGLVSRCLARDQDAQRELFLHLRRPIHRTLYRIIGSNENLPDLLQDSFLEIFRSLASFQGRSRLVTWADTIAARVVYRYLSSPTRTNPHLRLVQEPADDRSGEEARLVARQAVDSLYSILRRIEPKYRIAYSLHVIDGRPIVEVAHITSVSVVAAKNRVWRARKMVDERARNDTALRSYLRRESRG